jgi:hypothetical protein
MMWMRLNDYLGRRGKQRGRESAMIDILTATTGKLRLLIRTRHVSRRKLRLFAIACCRSEREFITAPLCKSLLDLLSRAVEDNTLEDQVDEARNAVEAWARKQGRIETPLDSVISSRFDQKPDKRWIAQWGACQAAVADPTKLAYGFFREIAYRPYFLDIVGAHFPSVVFDPEWRTSDAVSLGRSIYESRDFSLMPILGDALQDAGCEHSDLLAHCRGGGPHVRGCWVIDQVLDKE